MSGIAAWLLGWFPVWGTGALLTLPIPRARLRWRQFSVKHWALGMTWLVGMRRTNLGAPPRAPFLLVTNHVSYLDILLLFSYVDGQFIAKRDMRSWPLLGQLAQLTGTIWITREVRRDAVRVLDRIEAAIARGDGVILFPEGTTSSGKELLPMKPALLEWAARAQYPVHYATISYRTVPGTLPAEQAISWWGGMPLLGHAMNVLRMPSFDAIVDFAPDPVTAPTRAGLLEELRRRIAERFTPVGWRGEA